MNDFAELIRNAAEILGIQTSRVWPDMVARHWLGGLLGLVGPISIFFMGCLGTAFSLKKVFLFTDDGPQNEKDIIALGILVASGFALAIGLIGFLALFSSSIQTLLHPEADLILRKIAKG